MSISRYFDISVSSHPSYFPFAFPLPLSNPFDIPTSRSVDISVSLPSVLAPSTCLPLVSIGCSSGAHYDVALTSTREYPAFSSYSTPASRTQQPIPHFPESAVHSASNPHSPATGPLYSPTSLSLFISFLYATFLRVCLLRPLAPNLIRVRHTSLSLFFIERKINNRVPFVLLYCHILEVKVRNIKVHMLLSNIQIQTLQYPIIHFSPNDILLQ